MSSLVADEGEPLATGWGPDLPDDDSIVRAAVLVHASWAIAQAQELGRPWHDGAEWAAGQTNDRAAIANWVVLKQPLLDLERIVGEVATLIPDEVPYLLVSPWPTGDLRPLGLGLVGHPPLMYRPAGPEPAPTDADVRWATTTDDLAVAERILVDGYPIPELQPFVPGTLYGPMLLARGTRVAIGAVGSQPVATAAVHTAHGVNLVENVAVLPAGRGRGAGAAVTAAATWATGQPAVLIASDDGQPVYERLGYVRIERWTIWARAIGASS